MRHVATLVVATLLFILLGTSTAEGQVSIEINLPAFPELVIVPGYPVYYAPSVRANYFFDDGLYWVFNVEDGYWYSSSWYNGPGLRRASLRAPVHSGGSVPLLPGPARVLEGVAG